MAALTAVQDKSITVSPFLVAVKPVGVLGALSPVGTIGAKSVKWSTLAVKVLLVVSSVAATGSQVLEEVFQKASCRLFSEPAGMSESL